MRLNLYMYVSEYIDKKIERLILGGGGEYSYRQQLRRMATPDDIQA